jgi:hypothetical protein
MMTVQMMMMMEGMEKRGRMMRSHTLLELELPLPEIFHNMAPNLLI